jgi:hypothetical protein
MQQTTFPGRDSTSRVGEGGYLLGRKRALFHSDTMRLHPAARLYNFLQALRGKCVQVPKFLVSRPKQVKGFIGSSVSAPDVQEGVVGRSCNFESSFSRGSVERGAHSFFRFRQLSQRHF